MMVVEGWQSTILGVSEMSDALTTHTSLDEYCPPTPAMLPLCSLQLHPSCESIKNTMLSIIAAGWNCVMRVLWMVVLVLVCVFA